MTRKTGKKFLSDIKLHSDYLKWREDLGRYETWEEACEDIINGHRLKYKGIDIEEELASALESMKEMKVFASQRNLQFRGPQVKRSNLRLYNCSVLHAVNNNVFQNACYLLINGCGVGISLLKPFVDNISGIKDRENGTKTFVIEDSMEGWADAFGVLLSSYFVDNQPFPEYTNCKIRFDYSLIRPEGSLISGGFKAPGQEPLKNSLEKIEVFLDNLINQKIDKLRPIHVFDIICHISDCILSGGVRRSALLMVVDPHDKEMIYAKTGNWRQSNPQRARSNNSVLLLRNLVSKEQFEEIVNLNDGDNDIGFIFGNSWFDMFNPCLSANSKILTNNGYVEISKLDDGLIHKIINKNGQEVDTKIRLTGYKPTINLHLSNNDLFTCTEDHRLIDCNNNEIEANNTKGIRLGIDSFCNNDFDLEYIKYGFLQGDGCLSRLSSEKHLGLEVNIGKKDLEIKELFNIHSDGRSFYLNDEDVKQKLIELEFSKETLPTRTLPKSIKNWTKKQKLSFLRGLWSANGSIINNYRISFKSSCKRLIEELQILLNEFDIKSYYTTNKSKVVKFQNGEYKCKESYDLNISKINSMAIFSKFINFEQKYKQESLSKLIKLKSPLVRKITNNKGIEPVYDFEMSDDTHIGVVNNILTHNCAEIQFTPILTGKDITQITYEELPNFIKDNKDMFGVQLCNLTSMNAEKIKNKEDFLRACKDEAILGTLQAGYTDFTYFKDKSEEITKKEALLGTSITGWMNNPKLFNIEWLQEGIKVILEVNEKLAHKLGINKAARTSCVKPEGNLSVVAQTSSGIHPEHSERYFRIMQINKNSDVAKYLLENASFLLEESVWSANNTDYVIFIPVTNPSNGLFKSDIKGIKHLELIKLAQENWVIPGTRKECGISPRINHNISSTVILDDKQKIIDYIWDNKDSFTAVSFISDYGDKDFNQAPFTSVLTVDEIFEKYGHGALFASGLIVDGLHYFNNNLWEACDCIINQDIPISGTKEQVMLKKYWLQRAKKFAKNYFKGDLKQTVYCLKDVHLCHKWETINRQMKDIDFSKVLTKPEYKNVSDYAAVACSGGSCEITKI